MPLSSQRTKLKSNSSCLLQSAYLLCSNWSPRMPRAGRTVPLTDPANHFQKTTFVTDCSDVGSYGTLANRATIFMRHDWMRSASGIPPSDHCPIIRRWAFYSAWDQLFFSHKAISCPAENWHTIEIIFQANSAHCWKLNCSSQKHRKEFIASRFVFVSLTYLLTVFPHLLNIVRGQV